LPPVAHAAGPVGPGDVRRLPRQSDVHGVASSIDADGGGQDQRSHETDVEHPNPSGRVIGERVSERPRVTAGDGAVRYADVMRAWSGAAPLALDDVPPGAESLLGLVARDGLGRRVAPPDEPAYGRPAEAQAKWEARHGRPLPDPTSHSG